MTSEDARLWFWTITVALWVIASVGLFSLWQVHRDEKQETTVRTPARRRVKLASSARPL